MADNLKAAAFAAGLSGKEKDQVDALSKALAVHKTLLALPQPVAQKAYSNLPADQQQSLATQFGTEQKPNRGWLGTAWHYTGGAVANAIGYAGSHILGGLNNVSDTMTRLYRTGAIAADQGLNLQDAWTLAQRKQRNRSELAPTPSRKTG